VNSQTINDNAQVAVGAVDQATGGALGQSGVSGTVNGVVGSTVGPDSAVGGTADSVIGAAGGALGGAADR
jgi:hypothetical protein